VSALSMFDVSANSLCDRCRDAGITAEFFTALACLVGTLAFGMVVIRMFDKGKSFLLEPRLSFTT